MNAAAWVAGATAGALATGAGAWGAVSPSSQLFGPTLRRIESRQIALTFDDGPNPAITPALLDLLDCHQARATFFLIGRNVRESPALAAELVARGHQVGNHTDSHPCLIWMSRREISEQLLRCRDAITCATGEPPRWMRPPFGFRGPQLHRVVLRTGHSGVVMWSAMAWDWKPQPAAPVIERLRRVRGGDIVLLHDGDHRVNRGDRRHTIAALEYWLPRWNDAGIQFVTLDGAI